MTTGLLVVIATVVAYFFYVTGVRHGIVYTDNLWREWLGEKIKMADQKTKVYDLYPERSND
jgi:hypothetical protein